MFDFRGNELSKWYDFSGVEHSEHGNLFVPFSDMAKVDSSGITSDSDIHARNAEKSVKVATTSTGEQTVTFTCDIPTNGERVGIWLYTTRRDIGVYGGNDTDGYHIIVKASLNGKQKTLPLRGGMNYYMWSASEVGEKVTSASVTIKSSSKAGGTVFLDSVEVGYKMTNKPIVMFNLDCSPNNFINHAGFDLFARYGFGATLQYNLSSDPNVGSDANGFNVETHRRIIEAGHDYATYSGWSYWDTNAAPVPVYDDVSKRDAFEHHADLLWHINNASNVFAPSIVHSTAFRVGEVYDDELCKVGFPLIRSENLQSEDACFASVDWDNYREVTPFFWWGRFDSGSDLSLTLKRAIKRAVDNNLCLQIGCHIIEEDGYTPSGANDMNIGVKAMDEILAYCKRFVNVGQLRVMTTSQFLAECMPQEKYDIWKAERDKSFVV